MLRRRYLKKLAERQNGTFRKEDKQLQIWQLSTRAIHFVVDQFLRTRKQLKGKRCPQRQHMLSPNIVIRTR